MNKYNNPTQSHTEGLNDDINLDNRLHEDNWQELEQEDVQDLLNFFDMLDNQVDYNNN